MLIRDYLDTINEVKKEYGGLFSYEVRMASAVARVDRSTNGRINNN